MGEDAQLHRSFLKALSAEQRRVLTQRSDRPAFIRLVSIVAVLLLNTLLIANSNIIAGQVPAFFGFVFTALLSILQGVLLVCLFHLLHECVHDTVFTQASLNRIVGGLCGFILFLPPLWFRYFHHAHHRFTQDSDKDPELESPKPEGLQSWIWHMTGLHIWWSSAKLFAAASRYAPDNDFIPVKKQASVRHEMLMMLAGYTALLLLSLLSGSSLLLWIWIVPLLLGQPFLRFYLLAEHGGCELGDNMFANTRTVMTHPLVRWWTWNMPYHTEHHVYPTVPFHQLPALHQLMKAHLRRVDPGYIAFNRDYFANLSERE